MNPDPSRYLTHTALVNNAGAVTVTLATWLAVCGMGYRTQMPHFGPAPTTELGAAQFVGGGTAMIAQQIPGPGNIAGTAIP